MGSPSCNLGWIFPYRSRTRATLVIEKELDLDYLNSVDLLALSEHYSVKSLRQSDSKDMKGVDESLRSSNVNDSFVTETLDESERHLSGKLLAVDMDARR